MEKILYLMRHGETEFNVRKKIQGWCDSPLTEIGIQQAKIAGTFFSNNQIEIDHAYSSTSERASETTVPTAKRPPTVMPVASAVCAVRLAAMTDNEPEGSWTLWPTSA